MINVEELLQTVSPTDPCGADLAYDPAMLELETELRGKPETQFSAAEDPDWATLRRQSIDLMGRSKNLRVAVVLCLSLLETEGLAGFRDGLAVIHGLLDRYWDALYPRLDPEDNNDPTERVNILMPLITPLGSFDDPMQFLRRLRGARLSDSAQVGRFSYAQITGTQSAGGQPAAPPVDPNQVQASFQDTGEEKLIALAGTIMEGIATAKEIDERLTSIIGSGHAPDWAPLLKTLDEIRKLVSPYLPAGAVGKESEAEAASAVPATTAAAAPGTIQSRQDVIRVLDTICDYYRRTEPSSPVPLLLRRARRLAEMDFLEIIGNLSPETLAPIQHITSGPDAQNASGAPSATS